MASNSYMRTLKHPAYDTLTHKHVQPDLHSIQPTFEFLMSPVPFVRFSHTHRKYIYIYVLVLPSTLAPNTQFGLSFFIPIRNIPIYYAGFARMRECSADGQTSTTTNVRTHRMHRKALYIIPN